MLQALRTLELEVMVQPRGARHPGPYQNRMEDAMLDPDGLNIQSDRQLVGYLWRVRGRTFHITGRASTCAGKPSRSWRATRMGMPKTFLYFIRSMVKSA